MVITKVALPVPPLLMALIVTLKTPVAAGVPVMAPVEPFTPSPPGSPVAPKEVGLPVAAIW